MAICEKCGTNFTMSGTAEVITSRVLCPPCAEARAAEKRARAAATVSDSGGKPAPAKPAPAAPAFAETARAMAPPPRAERPARPDRAGRRDDKKKDRGRGAKAEAGAVGADGGEGGGERRPHVKRAEQFDKTVKIGMIVALVLVLAAGTVAGVVWKQKKSEREAIEAHAKAVVDFGAKIRAMNSLDPTDAEAMKGELEAKRDFWKKESSISAEMTGLLAKATATISSAKEKAELADRLAKAEDEVKGADAKSAEQLNGIRRNLADIAQKAGEMEPTLVERANVARQQAVRAYAQRLFEEAKGYAAVNPDKQRQALTKYQQAEDEVKKLLVDANNAKQSEDEAFFKEIFKKTIAESDLVATAFFTDELINNTPWTDLLTAERGKEWNASPVKGFSHRAESGLLLVTGPDKSETASAIMSIGDQAKWRDSAIECEFEVESGKVTYYFRLGRNPGNAGGEYSCDVDAESGAISAGKQYTLTSRFVGSHISISLTDFDPWTNDVPWGQERAGAFGIQVAPGTKLKITKLRIKELR